ELLSGGGADRPGSGGPGVLTRASTQQIEAAMSACPRGELTRSTGVLRSAGARDPVRAGFVVVLTRGTPRLGGASECMAVLVAFGFVPSLVPDVGVAGLHRLLARAALIQSADAVVVVAGMEGALASVVGGLSAAPIVAVPTSVGYGASLEGVTALL